jgi:hypothetical protein
VHVKLWAWMGRLMAQILPLHVLQLMGTPVCMRMPILRPPGPQSVAMTCILRARAVTHRHSTTGRACGAAGGRECGVRQHRREDDCALDAADPSGSIMSKYATKLMERLRQELSSRGALTENWLLQCLKANGWWLKAGDARDIMMQHSADTSDPADWPESGAILPAQHLCPVGGDATMPKMRGGGQQDSFSRLPDQAAHTQVVRLPVEHGCLLREGLAHSASSQR